MTRLWTFQSTALVATFKLNRRFVPSWSFVAQEWQLAYQWMAARMYKAAGIRTNAPPVWCWHSCGGLGRGPTVETAEALLSDRELERGTSVIELQVPDALVLLSSYSRWNEFVGHVGVTGSLPGRPQEWEDMFAEPLLKWEDDSVQAVVPYIERDWIVPIRSVSTTGRSGDEFL